MNDSPPLVTTHTDGPITMIVLNRADRKNALTPAMLTRIDELAHSLPLDCRGIVLCGEGTVFCSGFDMKLVHEEHDALANLLTGLSRVIRTLRRLPQPVIVAAHGAAVAGGCALLGGGDIVVTHQDAKLGYPVVKLGISPAVTVPALSQALGLGRARERTQDPDLISGTEAVRIGLAQVCCDIREDVIPRAVRLAKQLAEKPALAMYQTKAILNRIERTDQDWGFDAALAASLSLVNSADQRARVATLWR